mmetsp:Transcript_16894/g.16149  ORF Transcript_16894/g.16149 Transcript_16894/m.16149 type:complete len:112 (-) Transcript_16894:64-399(-)
MGQEDLPEEVYKKSELVTLVGGMGPGHCPPEIFEGVLPAMKKGGFFVFCIRDKYWEDGGEENPFKAVMDKLIDEGKYVEVHRHKYLKGTSKASGDAHGGWLKQQPGSIFCF